MDTYANNRLLARLSKHTYDTPRKVVRPPERVKRKQEQRGNGKDIEQHPADHDLRRMMNTSACTP